MKQLPKILLILMILIPLSGALMTACSEDEYCDTSRPMFICTVNEFYGTTDSLMADTLPSLTITAIGKDTVIFNNGTNVTNFELPMQFEVDTTALEFLYADNKKDTITFWHTNTPYYLSMECGFVMRQTLDSVSYTRHKVMTIEIKKTAITHDGSANIQFIYNN